MTYRMGRRDGVGSFNDKVSLHAGRGAAANVLGVLLQVYLGRCAAHRYESTVEGDGFQAIWHEKVCRKHPEPAIYAVSLFPLRVISS